MKNIRQGIWEMLYPVSFNQTMIMIFDNDNPFLEAVVCEYGEENQTVATHCEKNQQREHAY